MGKMRRAVYRTLTLSLALTASSGCAVLKRTMDSRTRQLARDGVQKHSVELNGDHIEYWDGGDGDEVVLLLHGFGGDALFQWFPQMRAFSDRYRVIAPDLLWFGGSHSQTQRTDGCFDRAHSADIVHGPSYLRTT